ncbi:MAG: class II histone deacetylase [Pseudomonadales bacterium]|nr:class II histone deacetylase [Pseudomonadales bacterium]
MKKTGFIWQERFMWHDTLSASGSYGVRGELQPGLHIENAETKRRLKNLLDAYEVTPRLQALPFVEAADEDLLRFHTPEYIERVQKMSDARGGDAGEHTPFGPGSVDIARLAVGGTTSAIRAVAKGEVDNAYSLTRPPGHHAERDRGRGFCIFNNIGLGVLSALEEGIVDRVAVVDWDVHHGNGTQQAFYNRSDVLTISLHQDMLFPVNLGKHEEIGEGDGEGFNLNVPLPAGCGGGAYIAAMDQLVLPTLAAYKPSLIVVACGYDASYFDPMSHMMLISGHFRELTQKIMQAADELCEGRLVLNHEGGYSEFYVPLCGMAVIEELTGIQTPVRDPYSGTERVVNQLIQPHQQTFIDQAKTGPLAALLAHCA